MARVRTGNPVGRPKGIWTPEIVKDRIRATKLVQRLQNHVDGKCEMTPTQLKAACFLAERLIPRAEAPKDINLNAPTLEKLIAASLVGK